MRDRQPRLPAFPTVIGHCIPALGQILFVPATHRVVIKVKDLRNLDTGFPIIQQQKRIRPTRNAMILSLTLHTRQKFTAVITGKKIGTDHTETRIHLRANINNFFGSLRTRSIPQKHDNLRTGTLPPSGISARHNHRPAPVLLRVCLDIV